MNHFDLIATSDWHLRLTRPLCRTDDFLQAQFRKVRFIRKLQQEYDCPVVHAGDLGDTHKWPPYLFTMVMLAMPSNFHTIYGQHDLPNHSLKLSAQSSVFTLATAKAIQILASGHFGQKVDTNCMSKIGKRRLLVLHRLVWDKEPPWSGCTMPNAIQTLKEFPQADVIISGDNHTPFVRVHEGHVLINPGSLTRQKADQANHKPRVYLINAKTLDIKKVYLPIEEGVVSREHINKKIKREERIHAFIEKLDTEYDASLDFNGNLRKFVNKNKISKKTLELIWKALASELEEQ